MVRRIEVMRRSGMLGGNPFAGEIRRAVEDGHIAQARDLAGDVYAQLGYSLPRPSGMVAFVGIAAGNVVGVMGIVPDSVAGLPSDTAFAAELGALRDEDLRLAEVTNLALQPAYRRTSLFFDLARACFAQALVWAVDSVFIAICPKHTGVFGDVLQFAECGAARNYSPEVADIVAGMLLDVRTAEARFSEVDRALGDGAFLVDAFFGGNPFHDLAAE
jgi:hypothetical protein